MNNELILTWDEYVSAPHWLGISRVVNHVYRELNNEFGVVKCDFAHTPSKDIEYARIVFDTEENKTKFMINFL